MLGSAPACYRLSRTSHRGAASVWGLPVRLCAELQIVATILTCPDFQVPEQATFHSAHSNGVDQGQPSMNVGKENPKTREIGAMQHHDTSPSILPSLHLALLSSFHPSIHPSLHPCVRPSVRPSTHHPPVTPPTQPAIHPASQPAIHPAMPCIRPLRN